MLIVQFTGLETKYNLGATGGTTLHSTLIHAPIVTICQANLQQEFWDTMWQVLWESVGLNSAINIAEVECEMFNWSNQRLDFNGGMFKLRNPMWNWTHWLSRVNSKSLDWAGESWRIFDPFRAGESAKPPLVDKFGDQKLANDGNPVLTQFFNVSCGMTRENWTVTNQHFLEWQCSVGLFWRLEGDVPDRLRWYVRVDQSGQRRFQLIVAVSWRSVGGRFVKGLSFPLRNPLSRF